MISKTKLYKFKPIISSRFFSSITTTGCNKNIYNNIKSQNVLLSQFTNTNNNTNYNKRSYSLFNFNNNNSEDRYSNIKYNSITENIATISQNFRLFSEHILKSDKDKDKEDKDREDEDKKEKENKEESNKDSKDNNNSNKEKKNQKKDQLTPEDKKGFLNYAMWVLGVGVFFSLMSPNEPDIEHLKTTFHEFIKRELQDKTAHKLVVNNNRVTIYDETHKVIGYFLIGDKKIFEEQLEEAQSSLGVGKNQFIPIHYQDKQDYRVYLIQSIPYIIIGVILYRSIKSLSNRSTNLFNHPGKMDKSKKIEKLKITTTFKDVAGLGEAKVEIEEFVNFLKNPTKYQKIGAKIPRGAILIGPPGTGKTLLAKAVAGESNVPFFSTSGSDFVEMFVGVGPARVRDLFEQAKKNSPCIVFIDEIDAIGRARGRGGFSGSNDERENTLNQLLVEMDGFQTLKDVVVFAATNRPDILDQALLRPGRFDRQITIDNPDLIAREEIFNVHLKPLVLDKSINYAQKLAALTPGFSGADIANVCNEAALIAARKDAEIITITHFDSAIDRVIGGLEKKNKVLSKQEKTTVAYHEAGHAVVSWFLEHCNPLLKVSIVPRGVAALGYAQYLPKEQFLHTKEQLFDKICMALGGRVAEQLVFNTITTGAQDDLEKITKMAYSQVGIYGMNDKVGCLSYPRKDSSDLTKPYSEDTAELIDTEVRIILQSAYDTTMQLLIKHRDGLEKVAQLLLEKEVIHYDEVEKVLGPRPFKSKEETKQFDQQQQQPQSIIDPEVK
ncbi:peptidase M41 [Tieghemostelium lacteum]|uniref:Peptidase M41 n=1 Tax=Tieghemostelium lacteum TaxID=361077 RepID=A0A151ZJT4_TIELA|nr:peptidase M41 [Tieghemostelium lacteum]|eukprot:KYQ94074.1 peptidase M41 [Tieghemostelium lacteum]